MIYFTAKLDPKDLDPEHRDDDNPTGLSEAGYWYYSDRLTDMGFIDPEFRK